MTPAGYDEGWFSLPLTLTHTDVAATPGMGGASLLVPGVRVRDVSGNEVRMRSIKAILMRFNRVLSLLPALVTAVSCASVTKRGSVVLTNSNIFSRHRNKKRYRVGCVQGQITDYCAQLIVLSGEFRGCTASLLTSESTDGVIKVLSRTNACNVAHYRPA